MSDGPVTVIFSMMIKGAEKLQALFRLLRRFIPSGFLLSVKLLLINLQLDFKSQFHCAVVVVVF